VGTGSREENASKKGQARLSGAFFLPIPAVPGIRWHAFSEAFAGREFLGSPQ
jgi:hypothetical protein